MASRAPNITGGNWRAAIRRAIVRSSAFIGGIGMVALALALAFALASYHGSDPSLNTAAGGPVENWLGMPGAYVADLLLTLFGLAAGLTVPLLLVIGMRLMRDHPIGRPKAQFFWLLGAMLLFGSGFATLDNSASSSLPGGRGGVIGMLVGWLNHAGLSLIGDLAISRILSLVISVVLVLVGLFFVWRALDVQPGEFDWLFGRGRDDDGDEDWPHEKEERRAEKPVPVRRPLDEGAAFEAPPIVPTVINDRPSGSDQVRRKTKSRQESLDLRDRYTLPGLDLLLPPPPSTGFVIDKAALERNARLLESVLDDFHVKGQIVEVRPGPVVTMYELEPAAGIKANRVVQLADDIARNMSALSARVATIPGRSVIGIELPNAKRESVYLADLVASDAFEDMTAQLPIILGKNISGDPVVADLAPMPHLLVAGTTGSGKSVGLNCMILSLLYRLTPEQCRMIMIDPKMLELSIYDDIPHLLAPVVTDPPKAIRALKWAVEQMEDRYRMMASVSVRSLAGFNEKVRGAKAKGQPLGRRVQTGYDADSGQPIYEEEQLEYEPLPHIVVIVDELADLMMTAGKEVEFLIQRLAQKARAAGIHLIMATQRPSVDVITGVIKANLPTRISFSVTSKIDSRTILGDQGAEQLLGKGDMLYMPGGKQISRVHGPFVSDEEVRAVADFWRAQGTPDYIHAVTEESEDSGYAMEGAPEGDDSPEGQLYAKAVQVVAESQKASTSYIQRQLRIGYNSAARLIERMEKEGKVGVPDHVGRREVLIDTDGRPV
ncbi:DNA translocase FtsK [Aquisediminimonas sediminicola]|uniref:DNA translocase FtsK n=1 Tax=Alteraquisediminimonas sediminicola TaxID=2676787 RepID=UPI001C8CF5EB|nr:DNA translocase FtsK [Aquisediminimonas sediminicola]